MTLANPGPGTPSSNDEALPKQRRDLLRDAINDIQGSIRANDAKSSAALVVHGLLFAGVLAITRDVKPVYRTALFWQQFVILALLGLALIAFLVSVLWLTQSMIPYHPAAMVKRFHNLHPRLFFPLIRSLQEEAKCKGGDANELTVYREKLAQVTAEDLEADYSAELLKLADIRHYEAGAARRGYRWLRIELGLVAAFLVYVAVIATSQAG